MFPTANPVISLRRELDRLFDDAFVPTTGAEPGRTTWAPAADVRETQGGYVIELELPGVDPAAVEVTAEHGLLSVRGEKRGTLADGQPARVHLNERVHGRFVRTFRLPKGFDEAAITAEFDHGVLRVRLPKEALPQPRRIVVNVGSRPVNPGAGEDAAATTFPGTSESPR
jgi:HSP20 family protein